MSRNLARRGGGSYNPNSNKAARQEKKNNKKQLSDNSGSDSDNNSQKRSRILTKDSMDEDYEDFVADAPADGGFSWFQLRPLFLNKIIPAALPKKILKLLPRKFCCAYAPGQDASSGANASIHAPRNKENNPSLTRPLIWTLMMFTAFLPACVLPRAHYSLDQKAARRAFVAVLSGLPANTKDIHLAPLVKEHGAKAINIPLSLNSYKPKPWAYVTFNSQETMDAAMEQTIGFQGRTLRWGSSNDSKALCHRCGKLGCAPTSCPLNQRRGRSRTRDPVAALKERFNIGQKPVQQRTPRNNSRSRSRSKSRDRSASAHRSNSNSNSSNTNGNNNNNNKPPSSGSPAHGRTPSITEKAKIDLFLFQPSTRCCSCGIPHFSLELNNQRLSAIEAHLGISPPSVPIINSEPDRMEEDPPEITGTLIQHPNAPSSSSDELNSVIQDQKAIKDTLQSLTGSIQGFIASLGGSPSDRASAPSQ
ncbi:hypothetical protein GLOIN_2v1785090 [Rhizophagus irregularis DAOM 181602=DAOM 197198]|nr:hypothetical protein GLOIN_2v1785090 [Rhizophagus irregularis DAOM 181602=DAOM 197198]